MAKKKNFYPTPGPSPQRGGESSEGARQKGGEQKAHKPNWRERYATMAEIEQFLSDHLFLRRNVVRGMRGYHVAVKSGDEIQSEKSLMAFDAIPESG